VRVDEISERKREVNDFNNVPPDLFITKSGEKSVGKIFVSFGFRSGHRNN